MENACQEFFLTQFRIFIVLVGFPSLSHRKSNQKKTTERPWLVAGGSGRRMSRCGACRDNAPKGPFFAGPEKEPVHGADFATRDGAEDAVRVQQGVLQSGPAPSGAGL
jgi:hypothetical protein